MLKIIQNHQELPFYPIRVQAGFPSPADDYIEEGIDLIAHLVARPASTFVMQVTGDSMKGAYIRDRDYIVVDKSLTASSNDIVVVVLNGEMTVKYFQNTSSGYYLKSAHPSYPPIKLNEENPPDIFGVVTGVFRRYG